MKETEKFLAPFILALLFLSFLSLYMIVRFIALFAPGYTTIDFILAILLFLGEVFIVYNILGFVLNFMKSVLKYRETEKFFIPALRPMVSIAIASYNEEPSVLEETILTVVNLDYEPKEIFLLDDSTKKELREAAEKLAEKYGVKYVHRTHRRGFKAGALNDALPLMRGEYLVVFDADQRPSPNYLRLLIPLMEADEKIAFIQTPQYYANLEASLVAKTAAYQQSIFYTYISEGKSVKNAMFSCGTNCIYRIKALREVGGFDETTVTEDIATSLELHRRGYRSLYYNRVYVTGEGPTLLSSYFIQQFRWAYGVLTVLGRTLKYLFTSPRSLSKWQWWEYLLSGSWYLVGFAHLFLLLPPIFFLLFRVRPLILDPVAYALTFVPYFIFSILFFIAAINAKGGGGKWAWFSQFLLLVTFPVYIFAFFSAVARRKIMFQVTPKRGGRKVPLKSLSPHILLMFLFLVSIFVGVSELLETLDYTVLVNVIWALFFLFGLSTVFIFNREGKEMYHDRYLFERFELWNHMDGKLN